MTFDYEFYYSNFTKLAVSLILGGIIGAEREYKSRNIGFRTIILITLGSTLFTIVSLLIGNSSDPGRIASNIVTGVGFIGAGAIFREGANVRGITTASIIWISAAIGMACGIEYYEFAIMVTIVVLTVLIGFTGMQRYIDGFNKEVEYKITIENNLERKAVLEKTIIDHGLKYNEVKVIKDMDKLILEYKVRGREKHHDGLLLYLITEKSVTHFEV